MAGQGQARHGINHEDIEIEARRDQAWRVEARHCAEWHGMAGN